MSWLDIDGDFLSLSQTWEQAVGRAGEARPWQCRPQGPHFEIHKDLLYRVAQEPETQVKVRQLLVPRKFQRGLLRLAHAVPWAGHLGREKTLLIVAQ